jgi:hypothetical protein
MIALGRIFSIQFQDEVLYILGVGNIIGCNLLMWYFFTSALNMASNTIQVTTMNTFANLSTTVRNCPSA